MLTPNQIYDYLRYYCYSNEKNVVVLHFKDLGTKNLYDLIHSATPYIADDLQQHSRQHIIAEKIETNGMMVMYDQEPIDIGAYCITSKEFLKKINPNDNRIKLNDNNFLLQRSQGIYNPIIAVSEINSNDVKQLSDNFHIPYHFWSNAFLSRSWYTPYEILENKFNPTAKRFGCYIRDTSGTRTYRERILNFFKQELPEVFCPILNNININLSSDLSASIPWTDHNKFHIQIVPETIFDTEKTHLTEKVFKPIVMNQPFILFAGPNSLEYMKSYGFKTFDSVWDESYDKETDSQIRFNKVIQLIKKINSLPKKEFNDVISKCQHIIKHNREHFYSDKFYKHLKNELVSNLETALEIQEEQFYTMPGGTLFYYDNLCLEKFGKLPNNGVDHKRALEYAYSKSKQVGDAILKQYSKLFN